MEALAVCPAETDADADMREVLRANLADWAALLPRPAGTLDLDKVTQFRLLGRRRGCWPPPTSPAPFACGRCGDRGPPSPARSAHSRPATDLAFRPDGRALLVGYGYGPARPGTARALVWDLATGQPVGAGRAGPVPAAPAGGLGVPTGRPSPVGIGTRLRTFDAASGEPPGRAGGATRSEIMATRFARTVAAFWSVTATCTWTAAGGPRGTVERIDLATGGRTASLTEDESGRPCQLDLAADRPFLGTGDGASGALVQPLAARRGPGG